MASVNEKMTALADEIRELSGTTTTKSIDTMTTDVNAANTEISEQMDLIAQISNALEGKSGGGGVILPPLSNPASASDILSGKEAIDGDGNKLTGIITTKTSSNLTASGATVTVPAGYYASNASKSVATATQATPSVSIDSAGKITASATQTAGYVSAGTKTGTKQLTTQAAKTVTPTTSAQTAVASGVYTTGAVTVVAIPSNYEDVTEETNAYTTKLASLESAVTALETELAGKASGGSGGGLQTCTVQIKCSQEYFDNNPYGGQGAFEVVYTTKLQDDTASIKISPDWAVGDDYKYITSTEDSIIFENVVCNYGTIVIYDACCGGISSILIGDAPISDYAWNLSDEHFIVLSPECANSTVTLTFTIE